MSPRSAAARQRWRHLYLLPPGVGRRDGDCWRRRRRGQRVGAPAAAAKPHLLAHEAAAHLSGAHRHTPSPRDVTARRQRPSPRAAARRRPPGHMLGKRNRRSGRVPIGSRGARSAGQHGMGTGGVPARIEDRNGSVQGKWKGHLRSEIV